MWCTVKTVISCPISEIALAKTYGTRDPGLPGEYTATAAIFSILTVALLGTFLRFSASLELDEEFNFEIRAGYDITEGIWDHKQFG